MHVRAAAGGRHEHRDDARGHRERGLDRFDETRPLLGRALQPVEHELDGVLLVPGERDLAFLERAHLAVDARADEALAERFLELLAVLAFPLLDDRRHDVEPRAERVLDQAIGDLPRAQGLDRLLADRAARRA